MTDLRSLNYFLGICATRDQKGLFLSLKKYASKILEWAHMLIYNPTRNPTMITHNPVETTQKLDATRAPIFESSLYNNLTGSLPYLTFTRPDITFYI